MFRLDKQSKSPDKPNQSSIHQYVENSKWKEKPYYRTKNINDGILDKIQPIYAMIPSTKMVLWALLRIIGNQLSFVGSMMHAYKRLRHNKALQVING